METEKKEVSTLAILKNDLIIPKEGKNIEVNSLFTYWNLGSWGVGSEFTVKPGKDYLEAKPIITLNKGSWSLVAGLSTNSLGADYAQGGAWYIKKHFGLNTFADVRYYGAISEKAISYFDGFFEATAPLSGRFDAGINAVYDYWPDSGSDWYLVGPVVYCKLSKSVKVLGRVSREWNAANGAETTYADRFRLALKLNF
jgi:hypothetical protein